MSPIIPKPDGLILKIYIQPKSSKNEVVGLYNDAVKIRLTAPPVDHAANNMCVQFLAKQLGLPKSSVSILSGHTSRNKKIFIQCGAEKKQPSAGSIETLRQQIETQLHIKKP